MQDCLKPSTYSLKQGYNLTVLYILVNYKQAFSKIIFIQLYLYNFHRGEIVKPLFSSNTEKQS